MQDMLTSSDNRYFIYKLLESYESFDAAEESSRQEIMNFILSSPKCFNNFYELGHVTGSALVTNKDFSKVLLTHHVKLNKWFQFGGHSDSDPNTLAVGLREAEEESNLKSLTFLPNHTGIFDVDVHPIPENEKMPLHNHNDIRILLQADEQEAFTVTQESHALQWVTLEEVANYNTQHAFLRMIEKLKNFQIPTTPTQ